MAIDVAAPANQWVVKGMPESVTIQGVRVHVFPDTVMCYNDTQVREDIKDGDVLVVPSDEIVGILVEAWPTAITAHYGELHRFAPWFMKTVASQRYRRSLRVALRLAGEAGWELDNGEPEDDEL